MFLSTTPDLHLIINAVGKDRLGIVSDVTGMVIAVGGNVGDSQAAKLGSHFSLMMEVTLPRDKLDTLKEQIESMPGMNAALYEDEVQDATQTPQIGCTLLELWDIVVTEEKLAKKHVGSHLSFIFLIDVSRYWQIFARRRRQSRNCPQTYLCLGKTWPEH
eukprot:scaffold3973_cov161-Amphora_coffeaeformis.AAC.6